MPFCLQKLRKQLTGALKPSLLLLCHSWSPTSPPDTALSECRDSLDQKSRLPMTLPWQNARSEVRTQSQSLADWYRGTASHTGQKCPRFWPREIPSTFHRRYSSSISGERDQVSPRVHMLNFIPSLVHLNTWSVSQVAKNASMSL